MLELHPVEGTLRVIAQIQQEHPRRCYRGQSCHVIVQLRIGNKTQRAVTLWGAYGNNRGACPTVPLK